MKVYKNGRKDISKDRIYKETENGKLKICMICEEYFPMTNEYFYNNKKNSKDGLNSYCIPCTKKKTRKYYTDNPEWTTKVRREWHEKNKEAVNKRTTEWIKNNKEYNKQYVKEYQQNNPDKMSEYNKKRREEKKHTFSNKDWLRCKEYFNNSCAYCGITEEQAKLEQNQRLHKEHVIHDGSNDLDNCVPSCKICNSHKWKYDFKEWYTNWDSYSEERYEKILKWINEDYMK